MCTKLSVGGVVHPGCQTRYSPDGLSAIYHYDGIIRKGIKLLKYRRVHEIGDELAGIVDQGATQQVAFMHFKIKYNPVVTAVPLFKKREKVRWFNQSEVIAKSLATRWNLEFQPGLLTKIRQTKPQAGLSREERLINVKGAFQIHSNYELKIKNYGNIILVDDVWTTGATMRECVNVLKRGGVKKVWCMTVAR